MKQTIIVVLLLSLFVGCKEEEQSPAQSTGTEVTDAQLYHVVQNTTKAAFYKNSTDTIAGNSGGAHPGKILVWYNAKAKEQLDASGKVKSGASFADSSLVVKEIFNANTMQRTHIAILFKLSSASNAGAGNWVWSELDGSGSALFSAKDKGTGCVGCHAANSFDYTLTNSAHP